MHRGKRVSVILPTYNEKDSIRAVIEGFAGQDYVDEILVVNNNAAPGTSEEVAPTAAREVHESVQGYGQAIRRGLREASGDYLVVCEPDGTFSPADLLKLLAYADDFDYVLGTRTTAVMIWEGANMGAFLKWGNWAVAKFAEFLFNCSILTDVGCTMRLIKRETLAQIEPWFTATGSTFGLEMTLLCLKRGVRFMEIPVNYRCRVGESSVTGNRFKAITLGIQMIGLILRYRFFRKVPRLPRALSTRKPEDDT